MVNKYNDDHVLMFPLWQILIALCLNKLRVPTVRIWDVKGHCLSNGYPSIMNGVYAAL